MNVCDFTVPELDHIRSLANFTPEQMELFDLRAQGISIETCAERMNRSVSSTKKLSAKVNSKIIRVIGR